MVQLDPTQFVVNHDIPILDEGELVLPREGGDEQVRLTPEYLRELRDHMNRREENTGDLCVLAVGHVKRTNGVEETSQAPVVGYAKNWTIKPLGNSGKLALHYDEWLRNEFADTPKKFPRRSADLWVKTKIIDPIAYLGATTPQRDIGLHPLSLSRKDDTVLRIPYPEPAPSMADEKKPESKGDAEVCDLLKQVVAGLTELKAQVQALSAGGPAAPGGSEGDHQLSPEEAEAELAKLLGEGPQGAEPEPKKKDEPAQLAKADMSLPEDIASKLAALQKQNDDLLIQMAKTDVQTKVQGLKDKGYQIDDVDDLVKDLLVLPPEVRVAQLARIEKSYRKAPGVEPNSALANSVGGGSKIDVTAVQKNALDKGISWEKSCLEIHGKLPGAN